MLRLGQRMLAANQGSGEAANAGYPDFSTRDRSVELPSASKDQSRKTMVCNMRRVISLRSMAMIATLSGLPLTALAQDGQIMNQVPLVRGFYLTDVMTCNEASNATLGFLDKNGFSSNYRAICEFVSIEWTDSASFTYVEACRDPFGESDSVAEFSGSIELLGDRAFRRTAPTGVSEWYYCQQDNLPQPWSSNDIGDRLK